MSGAIPQLPTHASMACIGTTIPLPFVQTKAVIVWDVMLCMVWNRTTTEQYECSSPLVQMYVGLF